MDAEPPKDVPRPMDLDHDDVDDADYHDNGVDYSSSDSDKPIKRKTRLKKTKSKSGTKKKVGKKKGAKLKKKKEIAEQGMVPISKQNTLQTLEDHQEERPGSIRVRARAAPRRTSAKK